MLLGLSTINYKGGTLWMLVSPVVLHIKTHTHTHTKQKKPIWAPRTWEKWKTICKSHNEIQLSRVFVQKWLDKTCLQRNVSQPWSAITSQTKSNIQQCDFPNLRQVTCYGQSVKTPRSYALTLTGSADAQVSQIGSKISGTIGATQGWECGFLRI